MMRHLLVLATLGLFALACGSEEPTPGDVDEGAKDGLPSLALGMGDRPCGE